MFAVAALPERHQARRIGCLVQQQFQSTVAGIAFELRHQRSGGGWFSFQQLTKALAIEKQGAGELPLVNAFPRLAQNLSHNTGRHRGCKIADEHQPLQ